MNVNIDFNGCPQITSKDFYKSSILVLASSIAF